MPAIYVERVLCKEFACLPSALRQERAADVLQLLTCMDVEAQVLKSRTRRAGKQ